MNWTPGPWSAKIRPGSYASPAWIEDSSGKLVASMGGADQLNPAGCSIGEAHANARLIAAAPTLATLLGRFYDQTYGRTDLIPELDFEQARNALARIEGER